MKNLYAQGAVAKSLLDSAETKLKVSEAQYNSAKQQLSIIQEGARDEDIRTAEAAVRQAEEGLATAKASLKQVEVAKDNVKIAETGVQQANAALQSALSAKQVNVMRDKDVLAAEAGVQQAREALAAALQVLDDTNIYSPVDGVVARTNCGSRRSGGRAGNQSCACPPIRRSTSRSNVSEPEATRLRAGQQVTLTIDALQSDRTNPYAETTRTALIGTVERVVPVVDARTRNFIVRVVVARQPDLFPGMFARGNIIVASHTDVIAVPKDAIVQKEGRLLIYTVDADTARAQTVTLGAANSELIQVLSGLSFGERIVVTGQQTLLDGDKVEIKSVVDDAHSAPAVPAAVEDE